MSRSRDQVTMGVMALDGPEPFVEKRSRRLEVLAPHLATFIGSARAEGDTRTAAADPGRLRASRPDLRVVAPR